MVEVNRVTQSVIRVKDENEAERLKRIEEAWNAYFGDHPRPLRPAKDGVDDNMAVNYSGLVVNKGVSFLFGRDAGPQFDIEETGPRPQAQGDEAAAAPSPDQEWLDRLWRRNKQQTFLRKHGVNGGVTGHTYVRMVPAGDGSDGKPHYRLISLDPSNVKPSWEPDDIENVWRYRIEYTAEDKSGLPRVYRTTIERTDAGKWTIVDEVQRGDSSTFEALREGSLKADWDWPFAPIVDCQNLPLANVFWGMSDLEPHVQNLNFGINSVVSNMKRIVRLHAHPKPWASGMTKQQANAIDAAIDALIFMPDPEARLGVLAPVGDLAAAVQLFERLRQAFHEVTRVPEVATGRLENTGQLSGVALAILYQPLLEMTEDKRGTYGDGLRELNRRLLAMADFGDEREVLIHWPEPIPSDPMVERQAAQIDKELGVSAETLLTKLGYDAEHEAEAKAAEPEEPVVDSGLTNDGSNV